MKKIIALLVLGLSACTNNSPVAEIAAEQVPVFKGIKLFTLPFKADTNFILNADTTHRLSYTEIRALGSDFVAHDLSQELRYSFNEACKIDSLKRNDAYATYLQQLDIGMTKDAIACKLGYINFKNNGMLLVWSITSDSYDACPVFSGTRIIGSYRQATGRYTHVLLGDRSYWADPPSTYAITLTTEIEKDEKFTAKGLALSDDLDTPGEETTRITIKLAIEADALKITHAAKDVKNTEASTSSATGL